MSTPFTLLGLACSINVVSMTKKAVVKLSYHHGDLRRALVAIGLSRVRAGGAEAFGLRDAARSAGVTPGATYKHFADKEALLVAIAEEGFDLLAKRMLRATLGKSGKERLSAVGRAYIDFASAEPRLFRLMFSELGSARRAREKSINQADGAPLGAFEQLREALAEIKGIEPAAVADRDLALAWSVAHGAACLICDGAWKRRNSLADEAMRQVVDLISSQGSVRSTAS